MALYSDRIRSRKNVLINGNFDVWKRGWPLANPQGYSADMWFCSEEMATGSITATTSTLKPDLRSNYSYKINIDTAQSTITANEYIHLIQWVEGYNFLPLVRHPAVLSFWVYCSTPGTYCVFFRSNNNDLSYIQDFTINSANTWELKRIPVTFDYTGGTWNYTTGIGLHVGFTPCCGSSYQTSTTGQWVSGNYIASTNISNNFQKVANNVFLLSRVQLERGTQATEFEYMNIEDTVIDTNRYYQTFVVSSVTCSIITTGTCTAYGHIFIDLMRTAPSMTITNAQIWSRQNGWRTPTTTTPTIAAKERITLIFQDTGVSNYTAGDVGLMNATFRLYAEF